MRGYVTFTARLHCYRCAKSEAVKVYIDSKDGSIDHLGAVDSKGRALCHHCFINGKPGDSGH